MLVRLLLVLTIVPAAELVVMIAVHRELAAFVGATNSLLISVGAILGTGVIGAWLARAQGLRVLTETVRGLARGESPEVPLLEGALVVAGGALLVAPGYLTDLLGFSFLIPGTRGLWRKALSGWVRRRLGQGVSAFDGFRGLGGFREIGRPEGADDPGAGPRAGDVVIDVSRGEPDREDEPHGPA